MLPCQHIQLQHWQFLTEPPASGVELLGNS